MVVTLTGANDFTRTRELKRLVREFIAEHTDLALERYDGEEVDPARMRESVTSLPFLTPRKLVVLRDPGKQKPWAENITDILKEVADTTDLVIVEPKLDKRLIYYKTLKKDTDFRDFPELDVAGLAQWATGYAKDQGGSLSSTDARLLVDRLGPNQQLMQQELDKLLTYEPAITKESIEQLVEPMPQSTIFGLVDAAFGGKVERALQLYREQRALKVEPQAIVGMLSWQLHLLALVSTAGERTSADIAREAKLNPYVVSKSQSLARSIGSGRLKQMIEDLLDLDIRMKTTSIDADEALRLYLLQLSNR